MSESEDTLAKLAEARQRRLARGQGSKPDAQEKYETEVKAQSSISSDRKLAIAWAQSTGLVNIPKRPHEFNLFIGLILAFFYLIPAIIYYFWCKSQGNSYNSAVSEAVAAWRANGSPNPFEYASEAASRAGQATQAKSSEGLAAKLTELAQLRDSGVLTEEEFQAAKKKELNI